MIVNHQKIISKLFAILLVIPLIGCFTFESHAAVSTVVQEDLALVGNNEFSAVENTNYYKNTYKYGRGSFTKTNKIKANKGNRKFDLKTRAFLPEKTKGKISRNPQSMVITGKYTYVLYTKKEGSNKGWIIRYNTKNLKKKSADKVKKGMKVGGTFTTGHGQSLSYNPKTKELWMIQDLSTKCVPGEQATLLRISTKSLKPNAAIKFKLKSSVAMGHNLAFDENGNAYFFTQVASNSGKGAKGNIKLYKGTISTSKVEFQLMEQGLKTGPGEHLQGLGYDTKSKRLCLVADGSIVSVPVNNMGNLTAGDIKATQFKTKREFEAVEFDSKGYAYLLTNRGPEILRSTKKAY